MKRIDKEIKVGDVNYILGIGNEDLMIRTGISALTAHINFDDLIFAKDMETMYSKDFMVSFDLKDKYEEVKAFLIENNIEIVERYSNSYQAAFSSDVCGDLEAEYRQYMDDNRE